MTNILDEIILNKRQDIEIARRLRPLNQLLDDVAKAPAVRDFFAALAPQATPRIIAECKKQSPSRGILMKDYDPVALALAYERGGAAAISVLTDREFFGGNLQDLTRVRQAVHVPVLRKDFVIDEYQIYEARAAGADSFLLLSGVLAPKSLEKFIALGRSLNMEPLIESHTQVELEEALTTTGRIFGVNSRDLKDFSVDLERAKALYAKGMGDKSKAERILVCESGIKTPKDISLMCRTGYHAFLIGEALVIGLDPAQTLAEMLTVNNS